MFINEIQLSSGQQTTSIQSVTFYHKLRDKITIVPHLLIDNTCKQLIRFSLNQQKSVNVFINVPVRGSHSVCGSQYWVYIIFNTLYIAFSTVYHIIFEHKALFIIPIELHKQINFQLILLHFKMIKRTCAAHIRHLRWRMCMFILFYNSPGF